MHRTDAPYNDSGAFTDGTPPSVPATIVDDDWLNAVQEEIATVIEAPGLTLSKGNNAQLLQAITQLSTSTGFRNNILNPSGAIARRMPAADEFSLASSGGYTFDRWYSHSGDGNATLAHAANNIATSGNPQSSSQVMHWEQTSTSTIAPTHSQRIWTLASLANRTVTVSFMCYAGVGLTITPTLVQHFGVGGAADVSTAANEGACTITTGWQRFTRTFTMPTVVGKSIGTGSYWTELRLALPTASTFNVYIAEAQVESSSYATEFEDRSIAIERLLTARYCATSYAGTVDNRLGDTTYAGALLARETGDGGAGLNVYGLQQALDMRAFPTITWYSPESGDAGKVYWGGADRTVSQTQYSGRTSTGTPNVTTSPSGSAPAFAHFLAEAEL